MKRLQLRTGLGLAAMTISRLSIYGNHTRHETFIDAFVLIYNGSRIPMRKLWLGAILVVENLS